MKHEALRQPWVFNPTVEYDFARSVRNPHPMLKATRRWGPARLAPEPWLSRVARRPAGGIRCRWGGQRPWLGWHREGYQALLGVEESTPRRSARGRDEAPRLDHRRAPGRDRCLKRTFLSFRVLRCRDRLGGHYGLGQEGQVRSNTPTRCDPVSPYSLWIGCSGKQNIRFIVRIIRGYSKHRVNDAIQTLHGLIITQE
jgi:hypothetical protein